MKNKLSSFFKGEEENKYYSLDRILNTNSLYHVIVGERSNGKTYAVLKHSLEEFWEHKGQVGIIRRWQEDIKGARASAVWDALIQNNEVEKITGGEYTGIHYFSRKYYLCNYNEEGRAIYNEDDLLGHTFALSDTEHNKSISFPNIRTLVFDEFITRGTYLNDEFVLFMNTVSTIVRQRDDVTIFMLGNTVNKYCPYFNEMGLKHIQNMEQGTIDIYTYGQSKLKVAVEYCESIGDSKESNVYFAFDNPKLEMITSGAWELDIYPHLPMKYKPKDVLLTYFIVFDDDIFQCEIIEVEGEMFTYIHRKTTPIQDEDNDIIYSLEYSPKFNWNRSIWKPTHDIGKKILYFYQVDKVFYQDNEVGDAVTNYLKVCRNL